MKRRIIGWLMVLHIFPLIFLGIEMLNREDKSIFKIININNDNLLSCFVMGYIFTAVLIGMFLFIKTAFDFIFDKLMHKAPKFSIKPKLIIETNNWTCTNLTKKIKKNPSNYIHKYYISLIWLGYVLFIKSKLWIINQ